LDGVDYHIRIPHNANLNPAVSNPSGAFVEFWMQGDPAQSESLYDVVDKSYGFSDGTGWTFQGVTSSGTLDFMYGVGGPCNCGIPADMTGVGGTGRVLDDQFHHIAGVFTGSELQIYVDGVLKGSTPETRLPASNSRDVFIGRAFGGGTPMRHFRGLVDEVGFYKRALTAQEILDIFTAGGAGKCKAVRIETEVLSVAKLGEVFTQELKLPPQSSPSPGAARMRSGRSTSTAFSSPSTTGALHPPCR
jgi:hypothetical protein